MPTTYNLTLQSFSWQTGIVEDGSGGLEGQVVIVGDVSTNFADGTQFYLKATNTAAGQRYEASTIVRTCTSVFVATIGGVTETTLTFKPPSAVGTWTTTSWLVKQLEVEPYAPPPIQKFSGNWVPVATDQQLAAIISIAQGQ